jgi:hypothetical protein
MYYILNVTLNNKKSIRLNFLKKDVVEGFVTQMRNSIEQGKHSVFTIEHGKLKKTSYYIPTSEVAYFTVEDDKLHNANYK